MRVVCGWYAGSIRLEARKIAAASQAPRPSALVREEPILNAAEIRATVDPPPRLRRTARGTTQPANYRTYTASGSKE